MSTETKLISKLLKMIPVLQQRMMSSGMQGTNIGEVLVLQPKSGDR